MNLIEQGLHQVNLAIKNFNTSQKNENDFRKKNASNNENDRVGRGCGHGGDIILVMVNFIISRALLNVKFVKNMNTLL